MREELAFGKPDSVIQAGKAVFTTVAPGSREEGGDLERIETQPGKTLVCILCLPFVRESF
jgi:hypothetical protein